MKVLVLLMLVAVICGCTAQTTTQTTQTTTQSINDTGVTEQDMPVEHGTNNSTNETGGIYRGRMYSDNLFFGSCQTLGNNNCKLDDFNVRMDSGEISFFNDLCVEFGFDTPKSCAEACGCNQ